MSVNRHEVTIPKVSVIVPVYNASQWIASCASSILEQTFPHVEAIFIDDGSDDDSLKKLRCITDPRVRIITREKNRGVGAARNVGLTEADGELIYFLDADDWIDPRYIECLVKIISNSGADLAIGSMRVHTGEHVREVHPRAKLIRGRHVAKEAILTYHRRTTPSLCNKIYRRKIIDDSKIRFSRTIYGEDLEFNLKYLLGCGRVMASSTPCFYHYRRGIKESATGHFQPKHPEAFSHLICVVSYYGRESIPMRSLRAFRCYELFTSCLRFALEHENGDMPRGMVKAVNGEVRQYVIPSYLALLILWGDFRLGLRYKVKKTYRVFVRTAAARLKYS